MSTPTQKKKLFFSIRLQILIPIAVILGVTFLTVYFFLDVFLDDTISQIFAEEITVVSENLVSCIDGDQLEGLIADTKYDPSQPWPESMQDDRYWEVISCFDEAIEFNPRALLLTYHYNSEGRLAMGVDSFTSDYPEESIPFGEEEDLDPDFQELMINGLTEPTLELEYFVDEEGEDVEIFFAGFTPIFNSQGEIVAGLGVDMIASDAVHEIDLVRYYLLVGMIVGLILITIFIFYISSATTASLRVLNEASDLVANGDYEEVVLDSDSRFEDEVSELTEVFNRMVKQVYKRENKLIKHVTDLKLFIDQDRKKEEVDEILDSEFFRELQSKIKKKVPKN